MRTKPSGGAWGAIQELTDRVPAQYAPNMAHALFSGEGILLGDLSSQLYSGLGSNF